MKTAWPEYMEWACGHITDLGNCDTLEHPDGVPVLYDRLRHCFDCRADNHELSLLR